MIGKICSLFSKHNSVSYVRLFHSILVSLPTCFIFWSALAKRVLSLLCFTCETSYSRMSHLWQDSSFGKASQKIFMKCCNIWSCLPRSFLNWRSSLSTSFIISNSFWANSAVGAHLIFNSFWANSAVGAHWVIFLVASFLYLSSTCDLLESISNSEKKLNPCETFTLDKICNILFSGDDCKQICLQNISEYHIANLYMNSSFRYRVINHAFLTKMLLRHYGGQIKTVIEQEAGEKIE